MVRHSPSTAGRTASCGPNSGGSLIGPGSPPGPCRSRISTSTGKPNWRVRFTARGHDAAREHSQSRRQTLPAGAPRGLRAGDRSGWRKWDAVGHEFASVDPGFQMVIDHWDQLRNEVRSSILLIVRAARGWGQRTHPPLGTRRRGSLYAGGVWIGQPNAVGKHHAAAATLHFAQTVLFHLVVLCVLR